MSQADTMFERIACFVEHVAKKVLREGLSPEDKVRLSTDEIVTVSRILEDNTLKMFIRILEEQGCILVNKGEVYGSFNVRLTHQGWNLYRQGIVDETYGFLAMQFDDERIESFAHNMKFQLQKLLKVVLLDIRDFPEVGDLVEGENGIKSKIESSVFVVVDLTFANPGVYWEGGYAEGLGKHVVYTCRSEDDKDRRIHFNVEHQKCFFWGEDKDFFLDLCRAVKRRGNL